MALPLYSGLVGCAAQPDIVAELEPRAHQDPADGADAVVETTQERPALTLQTATTSSSRPSSGRVITLKQAVRSALAWHPSIDEAIGHLNQSKEEITAARAGYMPQVKGGVRTVYDSGYEDLRPQLNVTASQMVYDFGKVSSTVAARKAGMEISHAQLLVAVDNLIRDTAHAFIEAQRYRALLDVAEDQVKGVESIAELVRQRADGGASTRSDEVQAAARVQAAQSRVLEVSTQLSRWQAKLATLIGRSGAVSVDWSVPEALLAACNTSEPDWSQLPAVIRAEAERKEAEAELRLSRVQIFPTLSLEADAAYDLGGSGSSALKAEDEADFTVGLNLSGNLYDGGATLARRNAASHALAAADASREIARVETLQALADARSQTANMNQLLASLSSRIYMMQETRDLYRRQYLDLGTRSLLDLLNAEQELHQAHFDVANTTHDLRRLNFDCLFNSGASRKSFSLEGMTVRGVRL